MALIFAMLLTVNIYCFAQVKGEWYHNSSLPRKECKNIDIHYRGMAEWEEAESVMVFWDYDFNDDAKESLAKLIEEISKEISVLVIVHPKGQNECRQRLSNLPSVSFIVSIYAEEAVWARDILPMTRYGRTNNSRSFYSLVRSNTYYFSEEDEDPLQLNKDISDFYDATPHFQTQMFGEGGNLIIDGNKKAFSTSAMGSENKAEVERIPGRRHGDPNYQTALSSLLSLEDYYDQLPLTNFGSYSTNHVDTYMKLVDEELLFISSCKEGERADFCTMLSQLKNRFRNGEYKTSYGKNYRVVELPLPTKNADFEGDGANYINSMIINNRVFVPTFNDIMDDVALELYKKHMPGYEVIGMNFEAVIEMYGSIHCATREVGIQKPITILHGHPFQPTYKYSGDEPVNIEATVLNSEENVFVSLHYKQGEDSPFISTPMLKGENNKFTAPISISSLQPNEKIFYYISAKVGDKIAYKPYTAMSGGYYYFEKVLDANAANRSSIGEDYLFSFFPNPAKENITIDALESQIYGLSVYNVLGETVLEKYFPDKPVKVCVPINELAKGVFILKLQTQAGQYIRLLEIE